MHVPLSRGARNSFSSPVFYSLSSPRHIPFSSSYSTATPRCRCGCRNSIVCSCSCCTHPTSLHLAHSRRFAFSRLLLSTSPCSQFTPLSSRRLTTPAGSASVHSRPFSSAHSCNLFHTSPKMAQEYKLKDISSLADIREMDKVESEVEGIEGGKVLVVNFEGQFHAMSPKCTHYGAPLKLGVVAPEGRITCPWHGGKSATFCSS